MKRDTLSLAVGALCCALLFSQAAAGAAPSGFDAPESALEDPSTGGFYVSNVGGQPGAKDGNGFISKLDPSGKVVELKFLPAAGQPALNAPKGLALTGRTLWVTDLDRVVGFDVDQRKQVKSFELASFGVKFANDLVSAADGHTLYVSDTAGDQVLSVDTQREGSSAITLLFKGATGGANGLSIEPGTGDLLVASSPIDFQTHGQLWRFHQPTGKSFFLPSALSPEGGIYDGLAAVPGALYTSDWARGAILRVDKSGHMEPVVTGLKGPADFCITRDGKRLVVVDMMNNAVTVQPLPAASKGTP